MNETQRAAAERLAAYHAEQADHFSPFGSGNALTIFHGEAAALLRELAAEPAQEPVAWGVFVDDELFKPFNCKDEAVDWFQAQYNHGSRYDYLVLPLYAAPQQRKPLTDEQIRQIVVEASTSSAIKRDGSTSMRIARAIERAHGITGEPT